MGSKSVMTQLGGPSLLVTFYLLSPLPLQLFGSFQTLAALNLHSTNRIPD